MPLSTPWPSRPGAPLPAARPSRLSDAQGQPPRLPALPPGWEPWRGVNGMPYARHPLSSPPLVARGRDEAELRDAAWAVLAARAERAA
jgi:hypothetical protein